MAGRSYDKNQRNKTNRAMVRLERREQADARHTERDNRSPEEQLALLNTRPGSSKKERARLEMLLTAKMAENG